MAVSTNFSSSTLDLNNQADIDNPTALVWGNDGRLYVTEVSGVVRVLTVAFGDLDGDSVPNFYVEDSVNLSLAGIQNHNDDGTEIGGTNRQVTGIEVTNQYNAAGQQLFVQADGSIGTNDTGTPAVTMYVTSSDTRIGAGGDGEDIGLDTNSGVITMFTQTGTDSWNQVDIVRGLPRSEENHATNGLEMIQEFDGGGNLVAERLIVASGGNANTGAPSNNFAGQQEQPLSAAILEVNVTALKAANGGVPLNDNGRAYIYDLPTLNDPTRPGTADNNDPNGGNDGFNSATLDYDDPFVTIYSPGYRNAYDVLVTEDGRVWTYDNGANNNWGGRPIGETETGNGTTQDAEDANYIALNLGNGDGNANDDINIDNWNPTNNDQFHEITRSDDLNGATLSTGAFGDPVTYQMTIGGETLEFVYGGHPNPTRAEGALAGLLFSPATGEQAAQSGLNYGGFDTTPGNGGVTPGPMGTGTDNSFLLVSTQDTYGAGTSDFDQVIAWLTEVENNNGDFPTTGVYGADTGELTKRVIAVDPGVEYNIYTYSDGSGEAVVVGSPPPSKLVDGELEEGMALGQYQVVDDGNGNAVFDTPDGTYAPGAQPIFELVEAYTAGLPSDIGDIVSDLNPIEGSYFEGGRADGALDSGKNSINGLAEYTSTVLDDGTVDMSGAILATQFNGGGNIIIMGRNNDGTMSSVINNNNAVAEERAVIAAAGSPLGIATIGDNHLDLGLGAAFQGSIWTAVYKGNSEGGLETFIEVLQPNVDGIPLAGVVEVDTDDRDGDGIDKFNDPFEFSAENGYEISPGQSLLLDFDPNGQNFDGSFGGNTGLLGAALDGPNSLAGPLSTSPSPENPDTEDLQEAGATANQDATTGNYLGNIGDGAAPGVQEDGLFDGANIIPGGNAPIFNIKEVLPGTMIGQANTARDAMQTAIRPTSDVGAIVATMNLVNWIPVQVGGVKDGQVTGMFLGDGTQSNWLRVVFGELTGPGNNGVAGIEVGYELNDAGYTAIAQVPLPGLSNALIGNLDLQLKVDIQNDYALTVGYRLQGEANVTEIPLSEANLPEGVLRDVLSGNHTISDDDTNDVESGAAIGIVAETTSGNALESIDVNQIFIEALEQRTVALNEAEAELPGTSGIDTIVYEGTDAADIQLASNVENFDGSGSSANWMVDGNALDNDITVGPGTNTVSTGGGNDTIRGTSSNLNGDVIEDFSPTDKVIVTDAGAGAIPGVGYAAGPGGNGAVITINGASITFNSPEFDGFDPASGPETFGFVAGPDGVEISLSQTETVLYRVNVGGGLEPSANNAGNVNTSTGSGTIGAIDGGPDWVNDFDLIDSTGPASLTGMTTTAFTNGLSNAENEIEFREGQFGADPNVAPWQLFVNERGDNNTANPQVSYNFAVESGQTYKITLYYTENWNNIFNYANGTSGGKPAGQSRQFDVSVNGVVPDEFNGINPLAEILEMDEVPGNDVPVFPNGNQGAKGPFLGGALQREYVFTADSNSLTLELEAEFQSPKLNGIQIAQVGGEAPPLPDVFAPTVVSIDVENPPGVVDGPRAMVVVLNDNSGFNVVTLEDSGVGAISFTGIEPAAVLLDSVVLSDGGTTATITYELSPPADTNAWPNDAMGEVSFAAGAFTDNSGNSTPAASAMFESTPGGTAVVISVEDVSVSEGNDAEVVFTRSGDTTDPITVTFTVAPGTAQAADFTPPTSLTVTIPTGATESAPVLIPITDDDELEGVETITVAITSVDNGAIIGDGTGTVSIVASDGGLQIDVGNTILERDFEGVTGEPIALGLFDDVFGVTPVNDANAEVTGGKLVVQTAEGDINDGTNGASENDFFNAVDLSDPALTEIFLTTKFDNPFDSDFFTTQGITGDVVPNFAQQGIVFGTGTQLAAEQVKLVWGGVADGTGIQLWSKGNGVLNQATSLEAMAGAGVVAADVAAIEMSLGINKDGTLSQYVTLFDALGAVIGGIRPEATTGFATVAPATMPPAVLANLTSTTETTKVGVTSNDNSGPAGAVTSCEVSWDFLLLSSPQASSGVDETGPTASPQLLLPTDASGDIVVNVTYADATGVDAATVDANDVTLTGPAGDGGTPSVAYEPTTGVATYTFAAPLGGWAAGDYTAAVVAGEVADTSTAANTNAGGEQAVGTFTPTLDTVLSVTTADVVETGDSGTMPVPFTFALSDTAFTGDVEVTLSIDGAPAVPVTLSFTGGLATFNVDVPVDSRWNGTETATVEIASVVTAGFVADAIAFTATANVTEDDPSDNYDKDGALGAPPVQVGDFSDERLSPTDIGELNVGENLISASQQGDDAEGGRDRDFITFTIPEGSVLSQIFLDEYVGSDDGDFQGFMALQEGTAITVDPVTGAPDNPTNPEGPFAGILYGGQVGNDLIPELAAGGSPDGGPVGFPGFVAPLPAGTYTLWLNQGSESSATFRMVVQPVSSDDQPPTVDQGIAAQTTAEDALFSFTVPTDAFADDGGVENLTLTAVLAEGAGALPDWLSFDGTTFSGTPDNDQVGTITVEVSASDGVNAPVATTFELEVTNTNDAPTITGAIAPVSTPEGVATSAELSGLILEDVDVGDMPMLRVELADGSPLPAGITLDTTTLNVADTVPQGTYDIAVYANDGLVDSLVPVTFAITVGNPPPQADPVRIQAEDFTSSDGYNAQTQGAAEGGQVIFLPNQGASGTATYDLAAKGVLPGIYDITVGHFDENDGESLINVAISSDATTPFNESFILDDDDTSGNAAQSASFRAKLFSGVEIGENGVLVLTGTTDAFEFARVDFIDFQPVGNTGGGDNTAPFAPFPLPDQMLDENTPFDFNAGVLFADAEEDILSFTATSDLPDGVLPDGVLFDDATGVFSGSPTIPGIFEITVVANDGEFDSAPASFTLTVIDVSDPPVVVAPIADQTLNQGEVFSLDISASFADPEEETLEFSVDEAELPDGIDFDELTGIFSGTPTGPSGSYLITVTATDPANGSVSDSFLINLLGDDTRPTVLIEAEDGNLVENFFVEAGSRIRLLQEQSGEATYDLSDVAPGDYIIRVGYFDENDGESTIGVAVTSTGQPDFTNSFIADDDATSGNKAQAESFRVKTLDGTLSLGPDGVLTLTGQADEFEFVRIDYLELVPVGGGGNFAPVEAGNGAPDISLDGLIPVSGTIAPAFSDPEEDPLTYAKVAGPDWLDVNPVTGALTGTPDAGGVFEVTVSATDVNNNPNAPATSDFTITVDSSGNAAPTLDTPIAPITVAQDALFEEAVTFTDPEGGNIIYSLAEGTPEWLGIDEFGTLSGQPGPADVVENLLVEVIATDVLGASNSVLVDVTVSNVNDDPELGTPLVGQAAVVAEPFTYELPIDAFTDPDAFLGDTLTFSATLANGDPLPTWLSIDPLTGTLSGTPDSDTDLAVVIRATDVLGAFVDAPALSIVVTGDPIPVDPVTIEAEDFTGLPGSEFAVNNIASASGGQIIRLPSESSGTVTTDLSAFAGASYKVAVNYIDENDGVSSAKVLVDGFEIGTWLFDGQSGEQLFPGEETGGLAALGNYRVIEFATPFPVTPTSVLTLEVTSNANEFGRVDSIELIPSAGGPTNQAPTAVSLVSVLPQGLAEDADTSNPIKVADIVVTDDGLGANTLGLIGADAGSFEIVGDDLFLKAGTVLDANGNPTLDVAVTADDVTVGSTPDATSATLSVPVNDGTPSEDEVVLRINAFGPQVAAIDGGPVWQADGNGSPDNQYLSTTDSRGDTQGYSGDQAAIPDTVPQAVLDTARSSNAPFFYNIPVSDLDGPGVYRVVLYIAELFPAAQTGNFRIFDSSVEGGIPFQLDNIDPGAAFGANVGVLSAEVDVQDGVLNLGLLQNVPAQQNPIVNAIEIVKVGGTGGADTQPPTVSIGLTNPVDAASPLLVDVTLADASGIDASSLGSDDLTLSINGSPTAASVSFTGFAGGVASYAIAAPGGAWANGASVSVGVAAGAILDLASPANGNLATSQSLVLDLGSGSAPTNAAEAFAAQTDLDTSATYTNGEVGAAILEVTAGSNNIQGSNFGANSFEVTNVGDKKISAIFIDVSSALYPDSVFDPDGQGGDSSAKPWAVNSDGGTGAFVSGTGYFLPGPDPLPNNTGTGISSNGGFKGAMVKFNPNNNSNGFENGETVGFSGDMDPNSIAGLTKASVDDTAIDSWDVGGISGHELIGSAFTVLFDDGTTATGYLNSDGSASGATTIASQSNPPSSAPGLVVNGVSAGGTGTYGVTQPTVIVSGSPGDLVRITLTKGFDPVTSGAPSNIDQLVEDRLDRYDFKVNNSFDLQTQDVIIGPGGTFDASDLFDYNTAVANNVQDGTFPGDDVQQIAFVAAVIDSSNSDLPSSAVSDPIVLTNSGGPVQDVPDPDPDPVSGFFELQGSGDDVYFKIQIENPNGTGGTNPGGKWSYLTAPDSSGNQANFQGTGYYLFGSETNTTIDNDVGGNELLEYNVFVPSTELGEYTFSFYVSRDDLDFPSDQQNDLWLNFKPADQPGNGNITQYLSDNGSSAPAPTNDGFIKVFGGPQNGNWGATEKVDGAPNNFTAVINIDQPGVYTIQIDGRSQGYHIDYFELYKGVNPKNGFPNSVFNDGIVDPPPPPPDGNEIRIQIDDSSDDWEEFGGSGSADLEFGLNGSPQYVGLRFDGITIPGGLTIEEAYFEFDANGTQTSASEFTIQIENTENAVTYSSVNTPDERSYLADEFVWSDVEPWTDGETYRTPDISSLIEAVIGSDGVVGGDLAFLITGSGKRAAHSFDSGGGDAPELVILFEDDSIV